MTELSPEKRWYAGLALVLLTLAAYAQTISSSFHLDDYAIFADSALTSPDGWWKVFRLSQTRPLTYFTFWFNFELGGTEPWGYHAVNLAIHAVAVLAAWAVFRRMAGPLAALAATAVFALHPIQSEAVAYVFARATLLATLFCLLSWRDWVVGNHRRAAVWFLLGLLAKEECVSFPIFLLATEWVRGRWRRELWPVWTAMMCASVAAGGRLLYLAAQTKGAGIGSSAGGISPLQYLFSQPKVIWRYLFLFVCPVGQNFDHQIQLFAGWTASGVTAVVGLILLIVLAAWKPREGVWLLGCLLLIAPSSSVIPLADLMFEHRMYLPMISLSLGAGILLARLPRPALAVILVLMTTGTWMRARVWTSEETLWADAAAKSPAKARPKLQLARAIGSQDPQRARALLLDARSLEPGNPETFTQMGSLLLDQRDAPGALGEFDAALLLEPESPDAHSNRGTALYLMGRLPEAESEFRRALEISPCHPNARHNLELIGRSGLPVCP